MKIISKIKIHPFFYLFSIICIVTGYFKNFIIISFIILFHELGHILVSQLFHWKIEKIVLLPFGGITIFHEFLNRPMKEEFFIAIAGPIFQTFLFLFLKHPFYEYNLYILLFNLLPIFPLDGSKIFNLFLNQLFSFKKSHIYSIILSIIMLSFFLFQKNLMIILILFFLGIKTFKELKDHKLLVHKFLLERFLYCFSFRKTKIIQGDDTTMMKRDHKHLFYFAHSYHTEQEILRRMFDKKGFL